jgi:hypothetical protein
MGRCRPNPVEIFAGLGRKKKVGLGWKKVGLGWKKVGLGWKKSWVGLKKSWVGLENSWVGLKKKVGLEKKLGWVGAVTDPTQQDFDDYGWVGLVLRYRGGGRDPNLSKKFWPAKKMDDCRLTPGLVLRDLVGRVGQVDLCCRD